MKQQLNKPLLMIALLITLTSSVHGYAQRRLDRTLRPDFGTQGMSEYSWLDRERKGEPDYLTVNMSAQGGNISIANESSDNCSGYTKVAPHYIISWKRESITEEQHLRIFFIGEQDTILAIQAPNGDWLCNDDSYGTIDPTVDIPHPRTGDYAIWVGTPSSNDSIGGVLYATLEDYDPDDYPLILSGQFNVVGQGSGAAGAEIIYVEALADSQGLKLSIDARISDLQGTERIRLAAWPLNNINDELLPNVRGNDDYTDEDGYIFTFAEFPKSFGLLVRDYSTDEGPVEIFLPNNQLPSQTRFYIDLRIQRYDDNSKHWIDLRRYETYNLSRIYHTTS